MLLTRKVAASVYFGDIELFIVESMACWYWDGVPLRRVERDQWARA